MDIVAARLRSRYSGGHRLVTGNGAALRVVTAGDFGTVPPAARAETDRYERPGRSDLTIVVSRHLEVTLPAQTPPTTLL
jgi:hypothetical protein